MKKTLLLSGLAVGAMVFACWGQTAPAKDTPSKGVASGDIPSGEDLTKEYRDFKAYADELEKRLGELHQRDVKPQGFNSQTQPPKMFAFPMVPLVPMPPTTRPTRPYSGIHVIPWGGDPHIFTSPPSTQPVIPPGSRKYRFNGEDVYVIPLGR